MALSMSPQGVKALEQFEGTELEAYQDAEESKEETRLWSETLFGPRALARKMGRKYYFDNTPCSKGHIGVRYTQKSTCFHCVREKAVLWKKNNPQKVKDGAKRYSQENKKKIAETYGICFLKEFC